MGSGVGVLVGVNVGVGVGVQVGVGVSVGVGVNVEVGVGVDVGVAVGDGVSVGAAVGDGVSVGVAAGGENVAPMATAATRRAAITRMIPIVSFERGDMVSPCRWPGRAARQDRSLPQHGVSGKELTHPLSTPLSCAV